MAINYYTQGFSGSYSDDYRNEIGMAEYWPTLDEAMDEAEGFLRGGADYAIISEGDYERDEYTRAWLVDASGVREVSEDMGLSGEVQDTKASDEYADLIKANKALYDREQELIPASNEFFIKNHARLPELAEVEARRSAVKICGMLKALHESGLGYYTFKIKEPNGDTAHNSDTGNTMSLFAADFGYGIYGHVVPCGQVDSRTQSDDEIIGCIESLLSKGYSFDISNVSANCL